MPAGPPAAAAALPYWRLSAFYFWFFAVTGVLMPFLPPYLARLGFGAADIGLLLAAMAAARIVAPTFWGYLADRTGARLGIVRGGAMASLLAMLWLTQAESFALLAAVLGLYGLCSNAVLPQFEVVTLAHLGERSASYARVRLWGSVGFILAVLGAGWLTERHGLSALPVLVSLLLGAVFVSICAVPVPPRSDAAVAAAAGPLWAVLRRPSVLVFLGASFAMAVSHGPYYAFFTIHLEEIGFGPIAAGWLWAVAVLAEVALFACVPALLRRHALRRLLLACLVLTALRWVLTATVSAWLPALVLAQLLHAVSFGLFHACAMQVVRGAFPPGTEGRGQALYSTMGFGLGSAVGSAAGGAAWAAWGAMPSFMAAAALCLLAALAVARWMPGEPTAPTGIRAPAAGC